MDNNQNKQIEIRETELETITAPPVQSAPDQPDETPAEEKAPVETPAENPEEKPGDTENAAEETDAEKTETEEAAEEETSDKTPAEPVKNSRKRIVIPAVCASVFLLSVGILGASYVSATTEPIMVEIGEMPRPENIHENELLASMYSVEPYTIDVSSPGDHAIGLKFFGFLPGDVTVQVRDTTPPELTVTDVHTVAGTEISWGDFVLSCTDATDVTLTAENLTTDTAGEYTVTVTAADGSGNKTSVNAALTVWDASHVLAAELNAADLATTMLEKHPDVTEMDFGDISTGVIGEYILRASSATAAYVWPVKVADTTPPVLETASHAIRLGETVTAENFVTLADDVSGCTLSLASKPDLTVQGRQTVRIAAEDIHGNRTEKDAKLFIMNVPAEISLEYGCTEEEITAAVFADTTYGRRFTVSGISAGIGEHTLTLESEFGRYEVKTVIADTTPPVLTLTDVTVFKGDAVSLESFVVSAEDLSEVTFSYAGDAPVSEEAGSYPVTVKASDAYGNSAEAETKLRVILDTTPPVIYGAVSKTIMEGESVSFKKNVYAVDDRDGDVAVKVDSSAVNNAVPGTYQVHYTAVDSSGNEAKTSVYLRVYDITMDTVNALADQILWQITGNWMTPREKAWAIYEWCTSGLTYSTRTSYLMGNYVDGAYSGFTIRSGNCYIYYAVSSVLLTRAGLENMMIQRNDPANPHYWSLVNIDGNWYHFDTCPHYAGHAIQCFLLTDAEVKAYSENEVKNYYSFDSSLYPATP